MSRTKEEAMAAGTSISETQHRMTRRSPWHDYSRKGTYMLTLVVEGRWPLLGRLVVAGRPGEKPQGPGEKPQRPGEKPPGTVAGAPGTVATIELTALGKAIYNEEILKISRFYPMVEVWKLCIMPDHIHMIVRVKEEMPKRKHLGQVVWGFKVGCTKAWWRLQDEGKMPRPGEKPLPPGEEPPGTVAGRPGEEPPGTVAGAAFERATVPVGFSTGKRRSLFEEGYSDKILLNDGQLDNWKHYLDDNPRRLAIKRLHPDLFRVLNHGTFVYNNSHSSDKNSYTSAGNSCTGGSSFVGHGCQIVGNRFLMDIPEKMTVIVHRAFSDAEYADWRRKWLACGENGGVLVSASIATREKAVMREAMDRGYRIILLRENGFPPLYKPSGEAFDACSEGQLLQISPWPYHMERKTISREQCLQLNRLAEQIADGTIAISF